MCRQYFTSFRSFHRALAHLAFLPLLVTIITGSLYRVLRNGFNYEKSEVNWLLKVHEMSYIPVLSSFYPMIVGLFTLTMIITGIPLTVIRSIITAAFNLLCCKSNNNNKLTLDSFIPRFEFSPRVLHRYLGLLLLIPLFLNAGTGFLYSFYRDWTSAERSEYKYLLGIHQGSYLGDPLYYTSIIGILTLLFLVNGILLLPLIQRFGNQFYYSRSGRFPTDEQRMKYTILQVNKAFEMHSLDHHNSNNHSTNSNLIDSSDELKLTSDEDQGEHDENSHSSRVHSEESM